MPYPNIPRSKWPKMERCVRRVRARGGVRNVYAVCHASVMGKMAAAARRRAKKGKG